MALTAKQQKLFDFAEAALPFWFQEEARSKEFLGLAAKVMGTAQLQLEFWMGQTFILNAVGATGSDPDWLNQHAIDRGTGRQLDETDPALRERLRNIPDALTRPTLLSAAQAIVDAESIIGTVAMVELRRDKAFFGANTQQSGTGGTFGGTAPDMTFLPTALWTGVPFRKPEEKAEFKVTISGADSAGNDGTFQHTGLSGDASTFQNASGVPEVDATVSWVLNRFDRDDNVIDSVAGFAKSFLSRGYRTGRIGPPQPSDPLSVQRPDQPPALILILPFGSTAATLASVQEMLRQKKGAGVIARVERRQ